MKKVKIDNNFTNVLNIDPVDNAEKIVGKHHSEFSEEQNMALLASAFRTNVLKSDYLKSLGDTNFSMKWVEFLDLIKSYGFVEGLHYNFSYEDKQEQAIIYYHPQKGLVIWATSFWNGESVNSGTLYGQVRFTKHKVEYKEVETRWGGTYTDIVMTEEMMCAYRSLDRCSHESMMEMDTGLNFSYDVREALINKITSIETHFDFCNPWVTDKFLWFVDFVEDDAEGYDYKKITLEKIKKCPDEFQKLVKPCIDKLSQ